MGIEKAGASIIYVTQSKLDAIREKMGSFDSSKEIDYAAIVAEVTGLPEKSLKAEPFVIRLEEG